MALPQPKGINLATLTLFLDDAFLWVTNRRDRVRKYALTGSLVLFVGGLAWAVDSAPVAMDSLRPQWLLALLFLTAPVHTAMSSVEMYALSRVAGGPMSWRSSIEVSVYTTAANFLPIPGGVMTKLAAMKLHGVGYGKATAMVLLAYGIWGGLAFIYSGAALFWLGRESIGMSFGLLGIACLAICLVLFRRYMRWPLIGVIALTRLFAFPIDAMRFMCAMLALGATVSFTQASVLAVASVIAAAVVLVPSGIGVRELVVAALAPLVSIDPATGFLASTVGRVIWMIGLALITAFVAFGWPASKCEEDQ